MSARIGVLAHNQELNVRPGTYILRAIGEEMVRRLVAERISSKKIRMFAPDTTFRFLKPLHPSVSPYHAPESMPSREVPGVFFRRPPSDMNLIGCLAAQRCAHGRQPARPIAVNQF